MKTKNRSLADREELADIVKMLRYTASIKRTFICIDVLDKFMGKYPVKILNSLNQVLQNSPDTQVLLAGRLHLEAEAGK